MTSLITVARLSCVSAFGSGLDQIQAAIETEKSGLTPYEDRVSPLQTFVGAVPGLDAAAIPDPFGAFECRNNRLAELALMSDGFADAALAAVERYGPARVAVVLGTSTSGIGTTEKAYLHHTDHGRFPEGFDFADTQELASLSRYVANRLGVAGPAYTVSTACSSSTRSFVDAARLITSGLCDAVIAGGVDSLCETSVRGFNALQLLACGPCRPNDRDRDGISIGEAGGLALLERAEDCEDEPMALLSGYGESVDAHHMSSPHPEGAGAKMAMTAALKSAGLAPRDIDYVNMHGTGSDYNDAVEDLAITEIIGTDTPCSSTKGYGGHTLGAAGILEAAISIIALRNGIVPGNVHLRDLDPRFRSRIVKMTERAPLRHVMTNNFGFGGNNCVLIFSEVS